MQFIEYNKTNNFFLCLRQFYNTTEKSRLKMKKKQISNQKTEFVQSDLYFMYDLTQT